MIWLIGIGGALGAAARYLIGLSITTKVLHTFPLQTWFVNISGSFLLGVLAKLYQLQLIDEWVWFALGVGFCGAYTTFSTFGYETIQLLLKRNYKIACLYVISSVLVGLISTYIGYFISK